MHPTPTSGWMSHKFDLSCYKSPEAQVPHMRENEERWKELCRLASTEQDSIKLHGLIIEINRLLAEKENRLKAERNAKLEGDSKRD